MKEKSVLVTYRDEIIPDAFTSKCICFNRVNSFKNLEFTWCESTNFKVFT